MAIPTFQIVPEDEVIHLLKALSTPHNNTEQALFRNSILEKWTGQKENGNFTFIEGTPPQIELYRYKSDKGLIFSFSKSNGNNPNIPNIPVVRVYPPSQDDWDQGFPAPPKTETEDWCEFGGGQVRQVCKNCPKKGKKRYYNGTEPSPVGRGYAACFEKVGAKKKGKDGKMYIVVETKNHAMKWNPLKAKVSSKKCK